MSNPTITAEIAAGTWTVDVAHSTVGFSVRHLMSKIRGQFNNFEATITTGESLTDTRATASIDLNSIDTRNDMRDGHLRSADFFDVEQFGQMTFTTTSFDGEKAVGDLTIKGITRPVTLDVDFLGVAVDAYGVERIGFEATAEIDRKDFNITTNVPLDGGGALIGDKVKIELNIEGTRDQA